MILTVYVRKWTRKCQGSQVFSQPGHRLDGFSILQVNNCKLADLFFFQEDELVGGGCDTSGSVGYL